MYMNMTRFFLYPETSVFDFWSIKHVSGNLLLAVFYCYKNKTLIFDTCDCLVCVEISDIKPGGGGRGPVEKTQIKLIMYRLFSVPKVCYLFYNFIVIVIVIVVLCCVVLCCVSIFSSVRFRKLH